MATEQPHPGGVRSLREDALLGPVVREQGVRAVPIAEDFFARFVKSIIRQQVSMAAADAMYGRLEERTELRPPAILATEPETMRSTGVSARKAATITAVAEAFESRGWSRAYFAEEDDDVVIQELSSVTGVGVWTAKMQLIFSLGRPDVFPVEDLGIRRAMHALTHEELPRDEMVAVAERWRPYRSLASLYLWGDG